MRRKDHVQRRKEEKEKAIYKQHQDVSPYSLIYKESRVTVSKMQQRFRAIYAKPLPISKDITCKNIVVV
jgi:hypothetical protein